MSDKFGMQQDSADKPAREAFTITPHATDPLPTVTKAIYVGGAGNITLRAVGSDTDVTFTAPPVGTIIPICASHVRATTTATNLVGLA